MNGQGSDPAGRPGGMRRRRVGALGAGLAGAAALAAAGCGSAGGGAAPDAAGTPGSRVSPAGTSAAGATTSAGANEQVAVALNVSPVSLEPTTGVVAWNLLQLGLGETLSRVTRQGTSEPWLARSLRPTSETEWEVTLRDGVRFHDGKPLDAAALKASLERSVARVPQAASLLGAESIAATGPATVVIKTKGPNPALGSTLAHYALLVHDAAAAERQPEPYAAAPNLTGPFRATDFRKDAGVRLVRHPGYWGEGAKVGAVDVRFVVDAATRTTALLSKQVDLAYQLPHEAVEQVERQGGLTVKSVTTAYQYFLIYNTARPVFAEPAVRHALSLAVNRDALCRLVLRGGAEPATGPVSTVFPFALKTGHGFDLEGAKRELDGAGWRPGPDGVRQRDGQRLAFTVLTYPQRPELGQVGVALQAQLKEAGAAVELRSVDQINDALRDPAYDAALYAVNTAPTADPAPYLTQFFRSDGTTNYARFADREVDAALDRLNATADPAQRLQQAQQIQQALLDKAPHAQLVVPKFRVGLSERVRSYEPFPSDYYVVDATLRVGR